MLGRLNSRYAGHHPVDAWKSILTHRRVNLNSFHTDTRKRTCIVSTKIPSTFINKGLGSSRNFFTESIPPILLPPAIFTGLLVGLWTWKCFWIIVMQNKLLYLSWLPPFSRSDKIADYTKECEPVHWQEKHIQSLDGTDLAICEGRIPTTKDENPNEINKQKGKRKSVVICYFQGNGGSTPLRLPLLSQVLRTLAHKSKSAANPSQLEPDYTIVALSYRGYWTSSGRTTQSGIELDAQAFLNWVSNSYSNPGTDLQIVLWGHSLGSAVACSVLSKYLLQSDQTKPQVSGLIMEAPISNIKDMLISLYPQKWLPYRYLWPFSWNTWCTATSLEHLAAAASSTTSTHVHEPSATQRISQNETGHLSQDEVQSRTLPPIFILSAENDEVIPPYVAGDLENRGHELGLNISRKEVAGAMHTEGPMKGDGREALVGFIRDSTVDSSLCNRPSQNT